MKYLYKYPQAAFPYEDLVEENRRRGRSAPEYELLDTGVFDEDRYWDILIEYAKAGVERHPDPRHRHQPRAGGRRRSICCRRSGSAIRGPGTAGAPRPTLSAWERAAVIEADHDTLGMRWLVAEGSPDLLFTDNDTNFERLWGAPNGSPYVKDGIDDHVVRGVPGRVNPARTGTKAALHYRRDARPRRVERRQAPARQCAAARESARRRVRRPLRPPPERGRRVLRDGRSRLPARRRQARDAPGARRSPLDQAVLPLRRPAMARGRSRRNRRRPRAPARPQPRVDAPLQQRRHLDAGQVGVPVVRGLGPRLPLPAARPRRPGLRQGAARPAPARVVHAPERPAPGLRVGLQRRQPPGARLGRLARLQDRQAPARDGGPDLPRAGLPQAPAELHLVGEPEGRRGAQHLPGRASSASTTSASSTGRRPCPPAAISSSPTARAGWGCTASTCSRSRSSWRTRTPPTRTWRASSSSTSSTSRAPCTTAAARGSACGTRPTASSTTCCTCPTAGCSRSPCGRWWG